MREFLGDSPVGMTRHEEMLNILVGLYETGGCDPRTLRIVAQSVGIREYFDREMNRLQAMGKTIVIEKPVFMLADKE